MIVYPDPIQGPNTPLAKSFSYEPMPNIPQSQTPQISLRDYFAAAALQGLLSGYLHRAKLGNDGALMIPESIYETAYRSADEMINAKEAK